MIAILIIERRKRCLFAIPQVSPRGQFTVTRRVTSRAQRASPLLPPRLYGRNSHLVGSSPPVLSRTGFRRSLSLRLSSRDCWRVGNWWTVHQAAIPGFAAIRPAATGFALQVPGQVDDRPATMWLLGDFCLNSGLSGSQMPPHAKQRRPPALKNSLRVAGCERPQRRHTPLYRGNGRLAFMTTSVGQQGVVRQEGRV